MSIDTMVRQMVRQELDELLPKLLANSTDEMIDTRQVAEMTGMSIAYFENGRSQDSPNHPPYHRVGRSVRYLRSDVEKWIASRPRRGGASK